MMSSASRQINSTTTALYEYEVSYHAQP
jgi:hypothetical protein